jgi:hypothetical protein
VSITVDSRGLISGLAIRPVVPTSAANWHAVVAAVQSVGPSVHMLVADTTDGTCRPIHAIDPSTAAPLGSVFKLYVLAALGDAVAVGRVGWNQSLTVTAGVKSLPSGVLQDLPDGTRVTVGEAAAKMISLSDNTASDMLIARLRRRAVEAELARAGMSDPARDLPFLTTRELFMLKFDRWPQLAERYARAGATGRRALLSTLDRLGMLPGLAVGRTWTAPRDIDGIEWFASAQDLCRAYVWLAGLARKPGLEPIADVLEINDGGLGLDPARWTSVWFKGGSEPGVLTMTYQATRRQGDRYFVAVLAADRDAPIEQAAPRLLSAIRAAFTLAASSR